MKSSNKIWQVSLPESQIFYDAPTRPEAERVYSLLSGLYMDEAIVLSCVFKK